MQLVAYVPEFVVVHEVPKHQRREGGSGPELSDLVDQLTGDLKDYFRQKISETLTEKGHHVIAASDATSVIPDVITKALSGQYDLLTCSREMAVALYNAQSGINNAGLLVALSGTINETPALAILKLERLQGVRVVSEITPTGQRHFNMSHLRDLMLNERTRVFKAGVFALDSDGALEGVVSDEQRGSRQEEVATFFLNRFLGCQLRVSPKAATKAFFSAAVDWINGRVTDPDDKSRYILAVLAELSSEERDIDPTEFARRAIDVEVRDDFLRHIAANDVPTTVFQKDTALIKTKLKGMRIDIDNGIFVVVPPGQGDKVSFNGATVQETTKTTIEGSLKGFQGR